MQKKGPERKSIRLHGHDYSSAGYYFVTMCVKDRQELMGEIVGTTAPGRPHVELSTIGQCVAATIQNANRGNITIDKYVIMPNHVHMIVVLSKTTDDRGRSSLQQVVRNIKSFELCGWICAYDKDTNVGCAHNPVIFDCTTTQPTVASS